MILQFLLNGLISGVVYSLLAIGFALVYNTTRIFHIAAAALYVCVAYAFYFFTRTGNITIPIAFILALATTMILSLAVEKTIYLPLKNKKASLNVTMIASIGVMTILVNLIAMFFGNETKVIDNSLLQTYTFGRLIITTPQMYQAVIGTLAIVSFTVFIRNSYWILQFKVLDNCKIIFLIQSTRKNTLTILQ